MVGEVRGVGKVEGVDIYRDEPTQFELLGNVVGERHPHVHLVEFDSKQRPQVFGRELDHLPLRAVKVHTQDASECCGWVTVERVKGLDPHVEGAVRLGPYP
jgi:hypothetical protein